MAAEYDSPEAVLKLAETDPEFEELLKEGATPVGMVGTFEETAKFYASLPPTDIPTTSTDAPLDIPLRDGRVSKARVYTSSQPHAGPRPLIAYVYGGGWVIGEPAHVALPARALAEATGAVVVVPSYRLAPATPFPGAADDVWDAFTWLADPAHAARVGADVRAGLLLGGVSAGGNLAAVTAQRYMTERPAGLAPLTGVALVVPFLLEPEIVPAQYAHLWLSRTQNAEAAVIDGAALAYVHANYRPDVRSAQLSPFNAPRPHVGMPPVYIQVAGQDPLRDDGLVYARALREHGVRTRVDVYPGVPHIHNAAFPTLRSSQKANADLLKGAAWLLGKEISDEQAAEAFATALASFPASG